MKLLRGAFRLIAWTLLIYASWKSDSASIATNSLNPASIKISTISISSFKSTIYGGRLDLRVAGYAYQSNASDRQWLYDADDDLQSHESEIIPNNMAMFGHRRT